MENEVQRRVRPWPLILEAALVIAASYLLWAHAWPAWGWALFSMFVAVVMVMETLHRTGHVNKRSYQKYRAGLGAIMALGVSAAFLVEFLQGGAWWELLIVIALWWAVFDELRYWWKARRQGNA